MTVLDLSPRQRRTSLAAVIASMGGMGLMLGITFPLISVLLEARGVGTTLNGLNGAMPGLAILIVGPFLPGLAARLGTMPSMVGGSAIGAASILLMPVLTDLGAWFVLRFLFGVAIGMPWLVGETWINSLAAEESRGRVIGLYSAALFLGMALGPVILEAVGVHGWPPFLIAAASMLVAVLPLLAARRLAPPMPARAGLRLPQVMRAAPTVAGAALLSGLSEQAAFVLLPVYGLRAGLPQDLAVTLLTVLTVGAILLQWPLGWLTDHLDRRLLLVATAVVGIACPVLLPATLGMVAVLWGLLIIWGGAVLGFYTVGLALLGQRFKAGDLAVANAAFIVLYQLGSVIGPAAGGWSMELWDPHGLLATMAIFSAGFAGVALVRHWRGRTD